MLRVKDHTKFCYFDYESEPSSGYQLGDVLFKSYEWENNITGEKQEPEIGVVIQTFDDGDFRTEMWGMGCESEVRPATLLDIKKYRPKLFEDLLIS
jgi:hypothetical protein